MSISMNSNKEKYKNTGKIVKWIAEKGNKLPDPASLFFYLAIFVLFLSLILNKMGVSVTYLAASKTGEAAAMKTVMVKNLLSVEYFRYITKNFTNIYMSFYPLGMTVAICIAIGLTQRSGFFDVLIRTTLAKVPDVALTWIFSLLAVCANIASTAGVILALTLGAAIWYSRGRNPLVGASVGFVGAHAGYTANLLITADDVLLSGITKTAAEAFKIAEPIHPLMNWYAMVAATVVISITITLVTEFILPRFVNVKLDKSEYDGAENIANEHLESLKITEEQKKGLKYALIVSLVVIAILLAMIVPTDGVLRADDGKLLPKSPLLSAVLFIMFTWFSLIGVAYGKGAGTIKEKGQISKMMAEAVYDIKSYMIVCLPAAFMIQFIKASNLTTILAVISGKGLEKVGFGGIPLAICFMFFCSLLNLFMISGSSKWLILAPIFVPVFSKVGFSPALTQFIYRVGESVTNPITPLNTSMPVLLAVMTQYAPKKEKVGFGTVLNYCLPYAFVLVITLCMLLVVWMLFSLPMAPGVRMFMN